MLRALLVILAALAAIYVAANYFQHRDQNFQRRDEPYAPPKLDSPQRRNLHRRRPAPPVPI